MKILANIVYYGITFLRYVLISLLYLFYALAVLTIVGIFVLDFQENGGDALWMALKTIGVIIGLIFAAIGGAILYEWAKENK